jgi:hypothetical protein
MLNIINRLRRKFCALGKMRLALELLQYSASEENMLSFCAKQKRSRPKEISFHCLKLEPLWPQARSFRVLATVNSLRPK